MAYEKKKEGPEYAVGGMGPQCIGMSADDLCKKASEKAMKEAGERAKNRGMKAGG